jgi:hypothetical protein
VKSRLLAIALPVLGLLLFLSSPAHAQGQVYQPGDVSSVQLAGPYTPAATCLKGACAFTLGDQPQVVSTTSGPITDQALNSNTNVVLFTGAATLTINSFAGPANGRVIEVINNTGNALTFAYDTGATTANRIYTLSGAAESIANRGVALLVYSTTSSRWHLFAPAAGSSFTLATGEVVQINSGTSTVTDYSVNSTTTVIKFTGASSFSITGFTGGADGRVLKLVNATGSALNFSHQATSSSANQIYCASGAGESWPIGGVKYLVYSSSDSKWHLEQTATGTTYTATSPLALVGSAFGMANGTRGDITTSTGTNPGDTWTINSAAVTLAKMANLATATFIGRVTAGTGVPEAMTGTQATSLLDLATTSLKGLAPPRSGTATTYLDGTGAYSTPVGGSFARVTPSATTGTVNNWAPGLSGNTWLTVATSGLTTITGMTAGVDGQIVRFYNDSGFDFRINHQDAGSTATNRFVLTQSIRVLNAGFGCTLDVQYNSSTARWYEVAYDCPQFVATTGNFSGAIQGGASLTLNTYLDAAGGVYASTDSVILLSGDVHYGYNTNATYTGTINKNGYLDGQTQFRNLSVMDGKGASIVDFDGATKLTSIQGPLYINPSRGYRFHDDLEDCPVVANSNFIGNQFAYGVTGTAGNIIADNTPGTANPTWCRMSVNGIDTAKINAGFGAAAGTGLSRFVLGGMSFVAEGVVRTGATLCDATTDVCTFRFGFFNLNTSAYTSAIYIGHEPGSSAGFWRIGACAPAFGCTATTSSVAIAANTTYKLGISCTAAGACSFTVNGTSAGSISTTNVPTGTSAGFSPGILFLKTAGSLQRDMYVDYFDFYTVLSTPR